MDGESQPDHRRLVADHVHSAQEAGDGDLVAHVDHLERLVDPRWTGLVRAIEQQVHAHHLVASLAQEFDDR